MYYEEALKLGRKCYKQLVGRGEYPYLPVLEELLMPGEGDIGTDAGLMEIPIDFVIGTKTKGRTRSFAANFMPIMDGKTEFASKWISLCKSHLEEGIRDPVLVWEYMNRFYVDEGNKRVSVLKFFGAVSVTARVKRILPERNGDSDIERYYELLDFCEMTGLNQIEMSDSGAYQELLTVLGKLHREDWTEDERKSFSSEYYRFEKVFRECGGDRLRETPADALLVYLKIYGYGTLQEQTPAQIKKSLQKLWDEVVLRQEDSLIDVKMDPVEQGTGQGVLPVKSILSIPQAILKKPLRVSFLYYRKIEGSGWNIAHDEGRKHVQKVFGDRIETAACIRDESLSLEDDLRKLIREGAEVIFATDSRMINACLRVAVENPDVEILCCCLNKPYRFVRTYYPRVYEVKFITGAIAGALAKGNEAIGYICRYPIYGMIAEINAFARGVSLVNPDARVYLEWSSVDGISEAEMRLYQKGIHLISYRDFYDQKPGQEWVFGLSDIASHEPVPLAVPVWNWGVFYERIIASILSGTYKDEYKKTNRSLNYYWGMSSRTVDVKLSETLPPSVRYLGKVLGKAVSEGLAQPFYYPPMEREGTISWETEDKALRVEDIITMNTLEQNVVGTIPEYEELAEPAARELVDEIGVDTARKHTEIGGEG